VERLCRGLAGTGLEERLRKNVMWEGNREMHGRSEILRKREGRKEITTQGSRNSDNPYVHGNTPDEGLLGD